MARHEEEQTLITFEIEEGESPILVKLKKHNAKDVYYRFGQSMPLRTLFQDYCFRTGLVYKDTNFVYNDCRIPESSSAQNLNILTGGVRDHVIHVFSSRNNTLIDISDGEPPFVFVTVREFTTKNDHNKCYYYKLGRFMPLRFLMIDYCKRRGFPSVNVFFRYRKESTNGGDKVLHHILNKEDTETPNELEMKDDDVLYASFDQGIRFYSINNVSNGRTIRLRVSKVLEENDDTMMISYKMSRKMHLEAMMVDYCNHFGLVYQETSFLWDGVRLATRGWMETAEERGMKDDDLIYVFEQGVPPASIV